MPESRVWVVGCRGWRCTHPDGFPPSCGGNQFTSLAAEDRRVIESALLSRAHDRAGAGGIAEGLFKPPCGNLWARSDCNDTVLGREDAA